MEDPIMLRLLFYPV